MDKVVFVVDDAPPHGLAWMAPAHAPDLTDDQARTIAISQLGRAMDRLADAVERMVDRQANA